MQLNGSVWGCEAPDIPDFSKWLDKEIATAVASFMKGGWVHLNNDGTVETQTGTLSFTGG